MSSKAPLALTALMLNGCGVEEDQDGCPIHVSKELSLPIEGSEHIKQLIVQVHTGKNGEGKGAFENNDWRRNGAGDLASNATFPGCEVGYYDSGHTQGTLLRNYPPADTTAFIESVQKINSVTDLNHLLVDELLRVNVAGLSSPTVAEGEAAKLPYIRTPSRTLEYSSGYTAYTYMADNTGILPVKQQQIAPIQVEARSRNVSYVEGKGLSARDSISCSHTAIASRCEGTYTLIQTDSDGDFKPNSSVWEYKSLVGMETERDANACKPDMVIREEDGFVTDQAQDGFFARATEDLALKDMRELEKWAFADFNYDLGRDRALCEALVGKSKEGMTWVTPEDLVANCDVDGLTYRNWDSTLVGMVETIEGALSVDANEKAEEKKRFAQVAWQEFSSIDMTSKEVEVNALLTDLQAIPLGEAGKLRVKGEQVYQALTTLKAVANILPETIEVDDKVLAQKELTQVFSSSPIACGDSENLAYNLIHEGTFSAEKRKQRPTGNRTDSMDESLDFSEPQLARASIQKLIDLKKEIFELLTSRQAAFSKTTADLDLK